MRRLVVIAIIAVAAASAAAVSGAPKPPEAAFVLAGGGWGHGVGMSQWGAFGQAKAGRDYRSILAHYYRGTEIGAAPATVLERVRVLVGNALPSLSVTNALAVFDGTGKRHVLPEGPVAIATKLALPVGENGKPTALPGPLTFRAAPGTFLTVANKAYRGDLRVAKVGKRLQLVNVVGLEAYLLGVVPGEMPKDWPLEALKAQAVAARTYAVGHLVKGEGFDLHSDWRSQVYYGVGAEAPGPSRAVSETRGEIITFEGAPAQTLYFSSSGGRTISSLDAFGTDLPYLVAVDDRWDEVSPNHRWQTQLLSGAAARQALRPQWRGDGRRVRPRRPRPPGRDPPDDDRRVLRRPAERRPLPSRAEVHRLPPRRPAPRRAGSRSTRERDTPAHGARSRRRRRRARASR